MIDAGELPHLSALERIGGLARVATTTPAQTPVAWSTFATGMNPGGHGVFDFIRRDPKTYLPDLALSRHEQKNSFAPPRAVNGRHGRTIWDLLTDAGIPSTVIRCPCTYPPEPIKGRILAGMGVPDLRGGLGTSTFYTTDASATAGEAEKVVQLTASPDGSFATHVIGLRNPKDRSDARFEIRVVPTADGATIHSAGTPRELKVKLGPWSDWLHVKFKLGMFQTVKGMVRFLVPKAESGFTLYASPVNYDTEAPPFPISAPDSYAHDLTGEIGTYYTAGMIEDHAGLSNGRIDEGQFSTLR